MVTHLITQGLKQTPPMMSGDFFRHRKFEIPTYFPRRKFPAYFGIYYHQPGGSSPPDMTFYLKTCTFHVWFRRSKAYHIQGWRYLKEYIWYHENLRLPPTKCQGNKALLRDFPNRHPRVTPLIRPAISGRGGSLSFLWYDRFGGNFTPKIKPCRDLIQKPWE